MTRLVLLAFLLISTVSAAHYTVYAGIPSPNNTNAWVIQQYFPAVLRVAPGDFVTFLIEGAPHTVTFVPLSQDYNPGFFSGNLTSNSTSLSVNPLLMRSNISTLGENSQQFLSSGILRAGENWTIQVNSSVGSILPYFCLIHPLMRGVILVSQIGDNTSSVDTLADTQISRVYRVLEKLNITKALTNTSPSWRRTGNSTSRIWTVRMVGDSYVQTSYVRFIPANISIAVNDTVEFVNDDIQNHIVAFNTTFATIPPYLVGGHLNPLYMAPSTNSNSYSGGFATSGLLQPAFLPSPFNFPSYWRITFSAPGIYYYECPIHAQLNMVGVITVLPMLPVC